MKGSRIRLLFGMLVVAIPAFLAVSDGAEGRRAAANRPEPGLQWLRQFGTRMQDGATDVAETPHGIYVAGSTDARLPGQRSRGMRDAYLRKYREDGHILWTRQFGTPRPDLVRGFAAGAGGLYVVGETARHLKRPREKVWAFLRRYDSRGRLVWKRQFGAGRRRSDDAEATAVSTYGPALYVAGQTNGSFPGFRNAGRNDVFLRRYDMTGRVVWTRQFGTRSFDDALAVSAGPMGIHVLADSPRGTSVLRKYTPNGRLLWSHPFTPPLKVGALAQGNTRTYVGGHISLPSGPMEGVVAALDGRGRTFWTRRVGHWVTAIATGNAGVYVTGFGPQTDVPNAPGEGVFVRRYDARGEIGSTHRFGSNKVSAAGLSVTRAGTYVAGSTYGPAIPEVKAIGRLDAYLARFSP